MITAPVFPNTLPIGAPSNSVVPFTRAPRPLAAAPPVSATLPLPSAPAPLPSSTSPPIGARGLATGVGVGVSTLGGASATPAAVAAVEGGIGAAVLPIVAGAAAFLAGDLIFPQSAANAEAPGIDPSVAPSGQGQGNKFPVTAPNQINLSANYFVNTNYTVFYVGGTSETFNTGTGTNGSGINATIAAVVANLDRSPPLPYSKINSMSVVPQATPGAPFVPFTPTVPQSGTAPLQNPVPVDSEGNRRVFVPPPIPERLPQKAPSPLPQRQPLAPTLPRVPTTPLPPVVPDTPKVDPPLSPPQRVPQQTPFPYPFPLPTPTEAPSRQPGGLPGGVTVTPVTVTPVTVTPVTVTPSTGLRYPKQPTDEKGLLNPPEINLTDPPKPPTTRRQRGADCCDPDPCDLSEVLKKIKELSDCVCKEDREFLTKSLGSGDSGTYSLPPESVAVFVNISSVGQSVRSQSGNSNGQNILYIGSYAFGINGGFSDRNPISFENNGYFCPERASEFQFQLNFDSLADVTVLYLKPQT